MSRKFGQITYRPHHGRRSEGLVGNDVVVVIHKNKNHTHTNSGIYSVVVEDKELPRKYREIAEARLAEQRAYEKALADRE